MKPPESHRADRCAGLRREASQALRRLAARIWGSAGKAIGVTMGAWLMHCQPRTDRNGVKQIILIVNTSHLLQNICAHENPRSDIVSLYLSARTSDHLLLHKTARRLGAQISRISLPELILAIASCKRRNLSLRILIPHRGTYLTGHASHELISELARHGLVEFYDDGLTAACPRSRGVARGTVPRQMVVHTWDYQFLSRCDLNLRKPVPRSCLALCFQLLERKLVVDYSFIHDNLLSQQPGKPHAAQQDSSRQLAIYIASKGLNTTVALAHARANQAASASCYIPHYQERKNSTVLMKACQVLRPDNVEASLIGAMRTSPCTLYFGITSTILILLEARSFYNEKSECNEASFIFSCDTNLLEEDDLQEYESFRDCIFFYRQRGLAVEEVA